MVGVACSFAATAETDKEIAKIWITMFIIGDCSAYE